MAADALAGQLAQLTIKYAKWFQIHSAPSIVLSSEPLTLCPNRNMVRYEGTGRSCILQDSFSGTICQGTLDLPSWIKWESAKFARRFVHNFNSAVFEEWGWQQAGRCRSVTHTSCSQGCTQWEAGGVLGAQRISHHSSCAPAVLPACCRASHSSPGQHSYHKQPAGWHACHPSAQMWQLIPEKLMVFGFKWVKSVKKNLALIYQEGKYFSTQHTGGLLASAAQDTSLNSSPLWLDTIAFKDGCRLCDKFILLIYFSINQQGKNSRWKKMLVSSPTSTLSSCCISLSSVHPKSYAAKQLVKSIIEFIYYIFGSHDHFIHHCGT